jgi:hypothetical protein
VRSEQVRLIADEMAEMGRRNDIQVPERVSRYSIIYLNWLLRKSQEDINFEENKMDEEQKRKVDFSLCFENIYCL